MLPEPLSSLSHTRTTQYIIYYFVRRARARGTPYPTVFHPLPHSEGALGSRPVRPWRSRRRVIQTIRFGRNDGDGDNNILVVCVR